MYCFIGTVPGSEPAGVFTIGVTMGLAWEVPSDIYQVLRMHPEGVIQARHRRDLYPKIEALLDKLVNMKLIIIYLYKFILNTNQLMKKQELLFG